MVCATRAAIIERGAMGVPQRNQVLMLLKTGIQYHATAFAGILLQTADRLICVTFFSPADLGKYAVALTISGAGLSIISSATSIVLFPKLAASQDLLLRR